MCLLVSSWWNGFISLSLAIIQSVQCLGHATPIDSHEMYSCAFVWVPGHQYALILLQLSHKGGVRFGHSSTLLDVIKGFVQIPAVLLHGVRDHCGRRATYTHFTVHQALGSGFPAVDIKNQAYISAYHCQQLCKADDPIFEFEFLKKLKKLVWSETHLALDINL